MISKTLLEDPETAIFKARSEALNTVLAGLAIVGAVGAPLSASRALVTGWLDIYSAHLVIGFATVLLWGARKHLPHMTKFYVLLGLMWSVGFLGLINYGMLGAGTWWLAASALLGGMTVSARAGVLIACVAVLCTVVAAAGFVGGWLHLPVNIEQYMSSSLSWATFLIAAGWLPLLIFTAFVKQYSVILQLAKETAAAQEELRKMASTDSLTGALRSHVLEDRLEYALLHRKRNHDCVGVMFIDLDEFKPINDRFGHAAGDAVLVEVVRRARTALRADDIIARTGGDEFVIVLTGLKERQLIVEVAKKLRDVLSQPFNYQGKELKIELSIGLSVAPADSSDVKQLLQAADQSMYQAKRIGHNRICLGKPPEMIAA